MNNLIKFTEKGFYCEEGDFYIDPKRVVNRALITHAHSDHAIRGHKSYLSHYRNIPILRTRLASYLSIQGVEYGEVLNINGVKVTFFPSGHIIGSSQIKIENAKESWVISGDYKIEDDGISGKFTPIKCDNFLTETTFAQPIYRWESQEIIYRDTENWINQNRFNGLFSLITCYSLGKAQRLLWNLKINGKIYVHRSIFEMNLAIESTGIKLPKHHLLDVFKIKPGDLLLAPHSFLTSNIIPREKFSLGEASGWMKTHNPSNIDKKIILSDHADWNGLNHAVKETSASKIYTTHGFTKTYTSWLRKKGFNAYQVDSNEEDSVVSD